MLLSRFIVLNVIVDITYGSHKSKTQVVACYQTSGLKTAVEIQRRNC